jgi:hypothetical protein
VADRWLTLSAAVGLIGSRMNVGCGQAQALAYQAVDSGEIRCGYTLEAVAGEESRSQRELKQSIQRDAYARGFKVSGSILSVMNSRAHQEAHERALQRLVRLTERNSPEFKADLISGKISVNPADLSDWIDRQQRQTSSIGPMGGPRAGGQKMGRKPGGHRADLVRQVAVEIWGPGGAPSELPPQDVFKKIADRVQQDYQVEVSKTTVRRALGLR